MKKLDIGADTRLALEKLKAAYDDGRLRGADQSRTADVDASVGEIKKKAALLFTRDLKKNVGIKQDGEVELLVLDNYAVLIKYCSLCTCHYGIEDSSTGTSYYLGSRAQADCWIA